MTDDTRNDDTPTDVQSASHDDGSDHSGTSRRSVLGGFAAGAVGAVGGLSSEEHLLGGASAATADAGGATDVTAADCADPTQWPPDKKKSRGDWKMRKAFTKVNIDDQVKKVTNGPPAESFNMPTDAYHDLTCPGVVDVEPGGSFDVHVELSTIDIDTDEIEKDTNLYLDLFVDWDADQNWDTYQETRILNRNEYDNGVAAVETIDVPEDAPTGTTLAKLRLGTGDRDAPENFLNDPDERPRGILVHFSVRVREDTGDGPAAQPAVDSLWLLQEYTDSGDAEFVADWAVSSSGGDLSEVTLTLVDEADGSREDSATVAVGGDSASDTTKLVAAGDDRSGHTYRVELTATDEDGNTTVDTASSTENRYRDDLRLQNVSLNPIGSDEGDAEFEVGATLFGKLDRAELKLIDDADGQTEDTWTDTGYSPFGYTFQMVNQTLFAEGDAGSGHSYTAKMEVTNLSGTTVTETSSATIGRPDKAPTIDDFSLTNVDTDNPHAEFDADWTVSDRNHDLVSVGLLLRDESGAEKQWVGIDVRDESASGTTRLKAPGEGGSGKSYTAELVVTDWNGNTTSGTATASASSDAGNCVVDHFSGGHGDVADAELLEAINYWRTDRTVPGCDRTVQDTDMLELMRIWRGS